MGSSGGNHGVRERNGSMLAQCKDALIPNSDQLPFRKSQTDFTGISRFLDALKADAGSAPSSRIFGSTVKDTEGDRWPTKKQKTDAQKPVPSDSAYQSNDTARLQ